MDQPPRLAQLDQSDYSPYFAPFVAVETFMLAAGHLQDTSRDIRPLSFNMMDLYMSLVKEEYTELTQAFEEFKKIRNSETLTMREFELAQAYLADTVDGLFDLIWVTIGMMLAMGVPSQAIWREGARSNLAKIDPKTHHLSFREDGKILKPDGWTPPTFDKILKEHLRKTAQD